MQFKLLKPIFEFSKGYIIHVTETGFGQLGRLPWGYEIPVWLMKEKTDWFEEINNMNENTKSSWEEVK